RMRLIPRYSRSYTTENPDRFASFSRTRISGQDWSQVSVGELPHRVPSQPVYRTSTHHRGCRGRRQDAANPIPTAHAPGFAARNLAQVRQRRDNPAARYATTDKSPTA